MQPSVARVLIIAGSDSGGGAGIQGDIKTVTCLGGYAMSAITALTAQNTQGVFGIHPVPPDFIAQQIQLCLSDIGADCIKTGMLHSAEVIEAVAESLGAMHISSPHRGEVRRGASYTRTYPISTAREYARELRKHLTDAEKKLWNHLRNQQLGVKFRKQHPIGNFIADFACFEAMLAIELDGGQHTAPSAQRYDEERTQFLKSRGFRFLRFWNHEVMENLEGVLVRITEALHQESPPPNLPPVEGGVFTIPLILDPVMVAKGGAPLLQPAAVSALKQRLIPRATLITPNLPEAELLLGRSIAPHAMASAAEELLELGCHAVLLKGGHAEGDMVIDYLAQRGKPLEEFTSPRIVSTHTHGTGCTLASAIAIFTAQGQSLSDAVARARTYVQEAITHAPQLGKGHGPLGHNWLLGASARG